MLSSYDEQHTHAAVRIQVADGVANVRLSGSTKPLHWLHHFLPFAARREINAGREIAHDIMRHRPHKVIIHGYSLGGSIAHVVATMLLDHGIIAEVTTIGSKRPPKGCAYLPAVNYRNRGDWIPLISTPWRDKIYTILTTKPWRPIWLAHADY